MASRLRIDHVIYAVADLDDAARRLLADHGLASVDGGRHPGLGTANRIVPLGDTYIELLGVVDAEEAASSPLGQFVRSATADGDRLAGWALAADDLAHEARRLRLRVDDMRRATPDGETLRWAVAGISASLADPLLPFFIQWHVPPDRHPGRLPAPHTVDVDGIAWVELGGEPRRLSDWAGGAELPVRFTAGAPSVAAVAIRANGEDRVLRCPPIADKESPNR